MSNSQRQLHKGWGGKDIKRESRLVGYIAREDAAGGGSLIAFSHSSWNNYIYHFDGGLLSRKSHTTIIALTFHLTLIFDFISMNDLIDKKVPHTIYANMICIYDV